MIEVLYSLTYNTAHSYVVDNLLAQLQKAAHNLMRGYHRQAGGWLAGVNNNWFLDHKSDTISDVEVKFHMLKVPNVPRVLILMFENCFRTITKWSRPLPDHYHFHLSSNATFLCDPDLDFVYKVDK